VETGADLLASACLEPPRHFARYSLTILVTRSPLAGSEASLISPVSWEAPRDMPINDFKRRRRSGAPQGIRNRSTPNVLTYTSFLHVARTHLLRPFGC
jgi:hypothetical protein